MSRTKLAIILSSILVTAPALAHDTTSSAAAAQKQGTEPLFDNLGDLSYRITTTSELAQKYFNQGLRWTYAFNHAAARRAFQEAQDNDPNCAMCYWGEAFVLGPNINAPMEPDAISPALTALNKAQELAAQASEREQLLIAALGKRYSSATDADQTVLNQDYADAMLEISKRFPDDQDIATLTADALMNTSPWDYWEADGKTTKGQIGQAIALAEKVLAANPDHPGAIHFYIHLTEASADPQRAEQYADRLADLMPGAGHLVHMGSHTYYRIGRYYDSSEVNKKAVAADETYLAGNDGGAFYSNGLYPHNIHFVVTSAFMAGDAASSLQYVDHLKGKISDEVAAEIGWIQAILTAPYFIHAHLSDPAEVLQIADPGEQFPLVKAMWHYARGIALATQGDIEQAREESAAIATLNQNSDFELLLAWAVPAPDLLRLAQHVVEARIAQAEGDSGKAVRELEVAVAIQDSIAYMEPPYWYYPVRQSLGAALLDAGKPAEAEKVFKQSLEKAPNNGWALYGLAQAQRAQGDMDVAAATEEQFQQAWHGETVKPDLKRL